MDSLAYTVIASFVAAVAVIVALASIGALLWATREEATQELPETARVSVARLKPGDVVVIEYPGRIGPEAAELLTAQTRAIWPHNSVAIFESGGRVKVLEAATTARNPPPPACGDVGGLELKGI